MDCHPTTSRFSSKGCADCGGFLPVRVTRWTNSPEGHFPRWDATTDGLRADVTEVALLQIDGRWSFWLGWLGAEAESHDLGPVKLSTAKWKAGRILAG